MEILQINAHAPLASWQGHPGSKVKLYCQACSWSRLYDPVRVAERLVARKFGTPMTPISAVARYVQWPCPACKRMRWVSVLVGPPTSPRQPARR